MNTPRVIFIRLKRDNETERMLDAALNALQAIVKDASAANSESLSVDDIAAHVREHMREWVKA